LLDTALPVAEQQIIASTLLRYKEKASCFMHRTRVAGARRFVSHVLVPGSGVFGAVMICVKKSSY